VALRLLPEGELAWLAVHPPEYPRLAGSRNHRIYAACVKMRPCYNARSSSTFMFPQYASERHCAGGCLPRHSEAKAGRSRCLPGSLQRERASAFTLLELLIVVGIIALLLVLMAPAFTTIRGGTDVTTAAYTIKGALDTARTYAKANNTYTWVGFAGSIGPTITGQVQVAVVASKDGTDLGTGGNGGDISNGVTPVGKLIRIDNIDIGDTGPPTNDGTEFESRPAVDNAYRVSSSGDTAYPFTTQQVTFKRWIRFSPRGEAVVKGGDTQIAHYAEVGVLPTHGTTPAATINPASGNLVAIQINGFGSNVRIYRR
jgi:type II secretory pathway pseudopilin PulG